ncbi:MAG TPA: IPT/TIG domain-containing protein [Polyangia bacterium]|nr:IPT/TIG domain-containing protein [Polyangia bacterium]
MSFGPVRLILWCALIGCGAGAPKATITAVTPGRAYSDRPLRLTIQGQGFLPSFQIDPGAGRRLGDVVGFWGRAGTDTPQPVALHDFDWIDKNTITATMDPGLPAGQHTVEVTDPRGQPAVKEMAFWALGRDDDPPTVAFEKPAPMTWVVGGVTLDVAIRASDRDPGTLESLRWESWGGSNMIDSHDCRFEATRSSARCDFQVVVPAWLAPGDQFVLRAVATDTAAVPNHAMAERAFTIQQPPIITGLSPTLGGVIGGTDIVIRGSGFFPGTKAYLGGLMLLPEGGVVMDSETIFGRTPAHAEGSATVLVRTPVGDIQLTDVFLYALPPQIETIKPEIGDPDGATMIRVRGRRFTRNTQIFFGDTLAGAEPCEVQGFVSDTEIFGSAPAGRGRTSVWAFDADLGYSRLPDGFGWGSP